MHDGNMIGEYSVASSTAGQLEALLVALERDDRVIQYADGGLIDIRSLSKIESVQHIRDLIRTESFLLDLHQTGSTHHTPFGRNVKRSYMTSHYMINTQKGWVVFDVHVHANVTGL